MLLSSSLILLIILALGLNLSSAEQSQSQWKPLGAGSHWEDPLTSMGIGPSPYFSVCMPIFPYQPTASGSDTAPVKPSAISPVSSKTGPSSLLVVGGRITFCTFQSLRPIRFVTVRHAMREMNHTLGRGAQSLSAQEF